MKQTCENLSQENDYFSVRQEDDIVVFNFKGNAILKSSAVRAKEAVLDFFDGVSVHPEVRVVLLLSRPRKARREEYLLFFDMVTSSRLSKQDVLRMYRTVDQFILHIVTSNVLFINADCGQILPLFGNIGLACDYRMAGDNAVFQNPALDLGLVAKGGGAFFLNNMLGRGKALETMLSGKDITAQEALELGLLNRIVPAKDLEQEAMAVARRFAELPATSIRLAKRLSNYFVKGLEEYLEFENQELIRVLVQKNMTA